jgi:hypothetical protein
MKSAQIKSICFEGHLRHGLHPFTNRFTDRYQTVFHRFFPFSPFMYEPQFEMIPTTKP